MKLGVSLVGLLALVVACQPCVSPTPAAAVSAVDTRTHAERAEARSAALLSDGKVNCGAVWVSRTRILTALHCVRDAGKPAALDTMDELLEQLSLTPHTWDPTGQVVWYTDKPGAYSTPIRQYSATIKAIGRGPDLALLEAFGAQPPHDFTHVFAHPLKDGEDLDIVGSPTGIAFTYTAAHVAGTRASLGTEGDKYTRLLINGQLFYGNSGGGAFDENGDLAGIVDELAMPETPWGVNVPFLGVAIHRDDCSLFLAAHE